MRKCIKWKDNIEHATKINETKNFGNIYQNDKIHTRKVDESHNYDIVINEKR